MKPKPFWPLNHLTVPVVIFFSKARKRIPPDNQAVIFNFVDVFGKGARGRIQQGTAANRTTRIYINFRIPQGQKAISSALGILVLRPEKFWVKSVAPRTETLLIDSREREWAP
jgi:hypothetical protein